MRWMKQWLKRFALILFAAFLLVGCTSETGSNQVPPPSKTITAYWDEAFLESLPPVTLKMYLIGNKSKDFDLVYERLNQMLRNDNHAEVDVSFMGWGDYLQKYPLLFASGEDFDLVYTSNWALYNSQAIRGGFFEISKEFLNRYAPQTALTIFPEAWEQAKVNGKVYMLPMNYREFNEYVYLVRGDLMDKYGIAAIHGQDDFERFLEAVAENEEDMIPLDIGSDFDFSSLLRFEVLAPNNLIYVEPQTLNHFYCLSDTSGKVINLFEMPEFLDFAKKMRDWNQRGFWSKSALVNKVSAKDSFVMGRSASAVLNLNTANSLYISVNVNHPEWKVRVYDGMNGKGISMKPYIQNGMGISANSRNPERAMMFMDLVRNDQQYADLVTYGLEGIHYELTEEGKVRPLARSIDYPIDDNCNWGWRNEALMREIEGGIPNYDTIRSAWEEAALNNPIQSFSFDDSSVKNEIAAVSNLWNVDYKVIVMGFSSDPEADMAALAEKYRISGNDRIIQEQEKQIQDYLNPDTE